MPQVTFILPDKTSRIIEVAAGHSIMEGAVAAGIDQIEAECGGSLTCATCHVHVAEHWMAKLPPAEFAEADLLEVVDDPQPTSRLSCQIVMQPDLDGLVVAIP